MKHLMMLVPFLLLVFAVAGVGGYVTSTSVSTWYAQLNKPSWNPPAWVFGPVWTVLYILMAVAAWLVWRRSAEMAVATPLALWGVQLALNLCWSCLFFGLRQPGWAMLDIVLLWGAILATALTFWRATPLAAGLMLPYLLWVTFAAALNGAIWKIN